MFICVVYCIFYHKPKNEQKKQLVGISTNKSNHIFEDHRTFVQISKLVNVFLISFIYDGLIDFIENSEMKTETTKRKKGLWYCII